MDFSESGKKTRLGLIGLGGRGNSWNMQLLTMADVDITAVCDVYEDRIQRASDKVFAARATRPFETADYHDLFGRDDIDALIVITNWESHISIAIDCMNAGMPVAMEVGCASSAEECWQLVRTWEKTKTPFMMLENCCFGRDEMAVLHMARLGIFGELIHLRGGYHHYLCEEIGKGDYRRHYRQKNFMNRNGDLYPTHELGPIATLLGLNRGNRMLSLSSFSTKSVGMHDWYVKNRADTELPNQRVRMGDVVTTTITCAGGETVLLTHDCTLPRPYSRGGYVQGTGGIWMEDKNAVYLEGYSPMTRQSEVFIDHQWECFDKYRVQFEHPVWKDYLVSGKTGGHDGMDYLVMRAFLDALKAGAPMPIDAYDAAAWLCVSTLSEQSIAMGGMPVPVPDFTNGRWMHAKPTGFEI